MQREAGHSVAASDTRTPGLDALRILAPTAHEISVPSKDRYEGLTISELTDELAALNGDDYEFNLDTDIAPLAHEGAER